jgi:hypothetical protein
VIWGLNREKASKIVSLTIKSWDLAGLRPSELLDVNFRHLGFTFLIGRMTAVLHSRNISSSLSEMHHNCARDWDRHRIASKMNTVNFLPSRCLTFHVPCHSFSYVLEYHNAHALLLCNRSHRNPYNTLRGI